MVGEVEPVVAANTLLVAGVRDEWSLGWSAANAWLQADELNDAIVTVRSDEAADFIKERKSGFAEGRLQYGFIDWAEDTASDTLARFLNEHFGKERKLAGVVHSVAHADKQTFRKPAHDVRLAHYAEAFNVSVLSAVRLIQATHAHMKPNAGFVTFGFGSPKERVEGYGGPMAVSKSALGQLIVEMAGSLGSKENPVRTAEIIPGYIPTRSGTAVAMINRARSREVEAGFVKGSMLPETSSARQTRSAGLVTVRFMIGPEFADSTGITLPVDAGWSINRADLFVPSQRVKTTPTAE